MMPLPFFLKVSSQDFLRAMETACNLPDAEEAIKGFLEGLKSRLQFLVEIVNHLSLLSEGLRMPVRG